MRRLLRRLRADYYAALACLAAVARDEDAFQEFLDACAGTEHRR